MARFPVPGEDFGDYHVERQLGQGGMGVVFAATDHALGRTVALKVLPPELAGQADYRERFGREASILASLDSPHIITIFAHGEHDGCLYIATQHVPGGDLSDAIRAHGPVPLAVAATLVAQLAQALGDAHRAGVVHRDIKPSNVLLRQVSDDPFAYLCDFGIAQNREPGVTAPGSVAGTFAYLAPERCEGRPATPAADLYALGCVLWTAITGSAPYGGTDIAVGNAHLRAPVPQMVESSPAAAALNEVLRHSMAKDPAHRYPDAAAMRSSLLALAAAARRPDTRPLQPISAPPPGPPPVGPPSQPSQPSHPSRPSQPSHPAHPVPAAHGGASRPSSPGAPIVPPPPYAGPPHPVPGGAPRRSRAGLVVAAVVAAVVLIAGGVVAVALTGDDGDDRADEPRSESADPTDDPTETSTDEPTDEATDQPTDATSPASPTEPATREPQPRYPDVPGATGPSIRLGAASMNIPEGWELDDSVEGDGIGARDFNDFEGYYSSVFIFRTRPAIRLDNNVALLDVIAERNAADLPEAQPELTLVSNIRMPPAWLDGEQAARVRATYNNRDDDLDFVEESWYVVKGRFLYRVIFQNSRIDTRPERRGIIDPMVVSFRWR